MPAISHPSCARGPAALPRLAENFGMASPYIANLVKMSERQAGVYRGSIGIMEKKAETTL